MQTRMRVFMDTTTANYSALYGDIFVFHIHNLWTCG